MLVPTRLSSIALFSVLLLAVTSLPAVAQIHGVAPSVTSFGFGGSNNPTPGVAASVTSVGPNGFFGGPFISPLRGPRFDGGRFRNHPVGLIMPIYIPYPVLSAVAYAGYDIADDAEPNPAYSGSVTVVYERGPWYRDAEVPQQAPAAVPSVSEEITPPQASAELPVALAAQPATVLVYKDGHKAEVKNYAILGDTLFEFDGNLSHKVLLAALDLAATQRANDERGVDFHIPGQKSATP
jgi:hypothetical protein